MPKEYLKPQNTNKRAMFGFCTKNKIEYED
jgi:hypothetical protein